MSVSRPGGAIYMISAFTRFTADKCVTKFVPPCGDGPRRSGYI